MGPREGESGTVVGEGSDCFQMVVEEREASKVCTEGVTPRTEAEAAWLHPVWG